MLQTLDLKLVGGEMMTHLPREFLFLDFPLRLDGEELDAEEPDAPLEPDEGAEAGVDAGAEAGAAAPVDSVLAAGAFASPLPDPDSDPDALSEPDSEAGSLLLAA